MVFYRKYRPQTIEELDKSEIRQRLRNIFQSGRVPHAFLFAGPRGTGKTSAARIVAKIVNCTARSRLSGEPLAAAPLLGTPISPNSASAASVSPSRSLAAQPCNKCANCRAITAGTHMDILEIDAASNTGVDNIRALQEKINLSPAQGKKKIYIIDEVHMLSKGAFNALLKTLEEPPAHVIFILATTEPYKLPQTVVSRCVRLDFTRATEEEIVRCLRRVVRGESLAVEEGVLQLIAKRADGSFRDATKLLEQAVVESQNKGEIAKLRKEEIAKFLGRVSLGVEEFLGYLGEKKTREALEFVQGKVAEGVELKFLLEAVLEELHKMLMARYALTEGTGRQGNRQTGKQWEENNLKTLLKLFSKAHSEMRESFLEELPLELAIIEWCQEK